MKSTMLITRTDIDKKLKVLASNVAKDYKNKRPLIVGVLNGSYMLMADFTRSLWVEGFRVFDVEFIGVTSYATEKTSSRNPTLTKDIDHVLGRDILVVDDVVDTGWTLDFLFKHFSAKKPRSIKFLTLLSKPGKREVEVPIDYVGFEIGNEWVEGYGLDGGDSGRGSPDVRKVSAT